MRLVPDGQKHPVRAMIELLEPGELLQVNPSDFKWKNHTPNIFCREIMKVTTKAFRTWKRTDAPGWVIERVK